MTKECDCYKCLFGDGCRKSDFGAVKMIGGVADFPEYVQVEMVNPFSGNVTTLPMRREFIHD